METAIIVTKSMLMAAKRSLALAKTGFELMDKKRNILMHEMLRRIDEAAEIQGRVDEVFAAAYKSLQQANISYGVIQSIADTVPVDDGISIHQRSIVGIEIPIVSRTESKASIPYGFIESNTNVDSALVDFRRVRDMCVRLAEVENTVYRLAISIKKIQHRANALKNVTIPRLEENIKIIQNSLEEKEREEFSRLKVIKKKQ